MNARHGLTSLKTLGALGLILLAGVAQAGDVYWSVGVNAPLEGRGDVRAVVSNGAPYYYAQQPVIIRQPVLVRQPMPVYRVQPVVYQTERRCDEAPRRAWWHSRHHHHRHHREEVVAYRDDRGDGRAEFRDGLAPRGRHEGRGRWHD